MKNTLEALNQAVSPWWRPWWRRRAAGLALVRDLSGPEFSTLTHQAARLYWHPGRRVHRLVWHIIDEERQRRNGR